MEPSLAGASVGVDKDQNFEFRGKLLDGDAQVVDLFTAIFRRTRDDHVGGNARSGSDALDDGVGGIFFGSEDEEDFVVLMVKLAKRDQIAFEARLHSLARTDNRGARREEAGVGAQAAAHVGEPFDALPKQV